MTEKKCGDVARYRFTWPGQNEAFICEGHVGWLKQVASAMGLSLQVIPLGDDVSKTCGSRSKHEEVYVYYAG